MRAALLNALLVAAATLAGCGGGEDAPTPKPATATAPAAAPAPAPGAPATTAPPLPSALRVEKVVDCPAPRQDAKKCDPNAMKAVSIGGTKPEKSDPNDLVCADDQHCLPTTAGYLCGPCPERDSIRHVFKDRDFAPENNRDPFQSFVVKGPQDATSDAALPRDTTSRCQRPEQLRVANFSYQDLKLVGIIRQGTQRKVLMMDAINYGHIIKTGDCVGKEKAYVKDIGDNFVCFEMMDPTGSRPLEPWCPELHSKQVAITPLPSDIPQPAARPGAPVIAPPGAVTPQQVPPPPTSRTTTTITTTPVPVPVPAEQPRQAPTTINP